MDLTKQQRATRTIEQQEELLTSQMQLITVLKQEIRNLQMEKVNRMKSQIQCRLQLDKAQAKIKTITIELHHTRQNNQSLLQTFEAFKKQYSLDLSPKLKKTTSVLLPKKQDFFNVIKKQIMVSSSDTSRKENINENGQLNAYQNKISSYSEHYIYEFQENYQRFWEEEVLVLFKQNMNHSKIRNKLRSVISKRYYPEKYRYLFWSELIENKLMINQRLFYLYLDKVKTENKKQNIILMDLKRLNIKLDSITGEIILKDLEQCLHVFTYMRPDIGYVQGMPYFLWMLIIRMQKYQAYRCFTNLMVTDKFLSTIFSFDEEKIKQIIAYFQINLKQKRNKSYKHLTSFNITPDIYLIEWAYTFYCRAFTLSLSSKIWDLWLSQGYIIFFKVALTIFEIIEPKLLEEQYQESVILIRGCTNDMQQTEFLKVYKRQKLIKEETLLL